MANETIIINDDLRTMQIPSSITLLGVESDDDVNKIPFQMPKEYCGFDLSQFQARINYMNANGIGDIYIVDDLEIDGDDPSLMNFTWLVGRNACAYKGNTKFIVCLKKFDNNQNVIQEFNTTVYNLPVLEGLETTEAVVQQNADIIEYILKAIEDAGSIDLSNYYTKAEVNALKLANPYKLNINGTEYDGSEAVEMTIEGGSSATTETASGTIIHVTDAVPNEEVKSLQLLDSNASPISSAVICITNKNLFRIDLLADQTVNKGVTFDKTDDGSIHATGTTTGTYASAQVNLDPTMFVEGETYTLSSGKKAGGSLYVQLILNYTDNTTDYIVANSTPYTFSIGKTVASAIGSVQITNSGVTVDEWVYPMLELADSASAFVNNVFNSMTYTGATMPTLPDSISNIWSTNASVDNIIMEYWNDPVLAQVNELEKQFYQTISHDDALKADSEKAVQNKVVTAALATKIAYPAAGAVGQVLSKTADGAVWSNAGAPTDEQAEAAVNAWLEAHPEATTTVQDDSITVDKLANDTIAMINSKSGLTEDVKQALLACFAHVAWIDEHGQDYYDDLENALYPPTNLVSISATFNQGANVIYDTDDLDVLEQYLTVTAHYDDNTHVTVTDYALSGTLTAGTSTITVTYGGKTTTFNVTVTQRVLSSISAAYTQSGTVYDVDTLDSLKSDLVVTALYSDASTETVPSTDYTLSGTLAVGTSTITVSYSGKTTTFNVNVTKGIDYTLDALDGVTWNDGYTYNQSSGVKTAASNEHCSEKFTAQDCLYRILPQKPYSYRAFFVWDDNDNYFGYSQTSGDFPVLHLNSNHQYAVKAYTTGEFDDSTMTVIPVNNTDTASEHFVFDIADNVNSFTWSNGAAELDITSAFSEYGITTSNYQTKINHMSITGTEAMMLYLGALGGAMPFKGFCVSIGVYSNKILLIIKDSNHNSLALLTQYITENNVVLEIN